MKRSISSHDFVVVVVVIIIVSKDYGMDFLSEIFTGIDPHTHSQKNKKAIGKYWERVLVNTLLEMAQETILGFGITIMTEENP